MSSPCGANGFLKCDFRSERKRNLGARYWFDCHCEACIGNWPLLKELTSLPVGCEEHYLLTSADKHMEAGNTKDAIADLEAVFDMMAQKGNMTKDVPNEAQIRAEDKLRTCTTQFGNVAFASLTANKP